MTRAGGAMALPVLVGLLQGCSVAAVTDAAVTTGATVVKVGANVVGAGVDVARAGVRAVANSVERSK